MADMKETYTLMFTYYSDIVNLVQMRKMLGGISNTLAYRMLREKKIKSKKNNYMFISTNIISITISIYKKITNKKYIYSRQQHTK